MGYVSGLKIFFFVNLVQKSRRIWGNVDGEPPSIEPGQSVTNSRIQFRQSANISFFLGELPTTEPSILTR